MQDPAKRNRIERIKIKIGKKKIINQEIIGGMGSRLNQKNIRREEIIEDIKPKNVKINVVMFWCRYMKYGMTCGNRNREQFAVGK